MNSQQIRQKFLDYFEGKGHTTVPSSSLIPSKDPTLLFTNSGMVQFKDIFLGQQKTNYTKATSSQRCLRAGGKHNDLENVGYTARHHTFFEMLGNFSFGDYFKKEAINYAWEFLTKKLKIPAEKLWITVHKDDKEAEKIWLNDIKIDPTKFSRCGDDDNFWAMGDTGPCGPCTEIFYDHGPEIEGGPPGTPEQDGDRYIEIWNLVFMQYNKDNKGKLNPLPKPSVDTGMGLERLAAVLQNVHSNYETDLFIPLIKTAKELATYEKLRNLFLRDKQDKQSIEHTNQVLHAQQVLADHIRSTAFLIIDGIQPSNEGRGYVLRRIMRRAIRHGKQLGCQQPFFHKLLPPLIKIMGKAYPQLHQNEKNIINTIQQEEQLFSQTLEQGLSILEDSIKTLANKTIPGEIVFKLYDTYGFPVDLTADIAREKNLTLDLKGFETAMKQQRTRSQQHQQFKNEQLNIELKQTNEFIGHEKLSCASKIIAIYQNNKPVDTLKKGTQGIIILKQTPFYAEGGGQIGDHGWITTPNSSFEVTDTQKQGEYHLHIGHITTGQINIKDKISAQVDYARRQSIARHHSATHLLHASTRNILGDQAIQKGSLVEPNRLRFDFAYPSALTTEQITAIENQVNEQICYNQKTKTEIMSPEQAQKSGAIALFEDKYGDKVRVLSMGNFSCELCGGTHVNRTGDIGLFKIISETGIAAGIRRIEAITGQQALEWINNQQKQMLNAANSLKTQPEQLQEKAQQITAQLKEQEKKITNLEQHLVTQTAQQLATQSEQINDAQIITAQIDKLGLNSAKALRSLLDQLKDKLPKSIIVLAASDQDKVQIIAGVSKQLSKDYHAGKLIEHIAPHINGKGGGRPDMAQAGGTNPQGINEALKAAKKWIKNNETIKA